MIIGTIEEAKTFQLQGMKDWWLNAETLEVATDEEIIAFLDIWEELRDFGYSFGVTGRGQITRAIGLVHRKEVEMAAEGKKYFGATGAQMLCGKTSRKDLKEVVVKEITRLETDLAGYEKIAKEAEPGSCKQRFAKNGYEYTRGALGAARNIALYFVEHERYEKYKAWKGEYATYAQRIRAEKSK